MGYRFLIIKSRVFDMKLGTIIGSIDATFSKSEFSMKYICSISSHESSIFEMVEPLIHTDFEIQKRINYSHPKEYETDDNKVFLRRLYYIPCEWYSQNHRRGILISWCWLMEGNYSQWDGLNYG